jgi:glyoxylase-like metal-dependent hydrolase (beta-lactamase superfamily II)
VLFDTGQDRASVTDPGYFPAGLAGRLYARLARFAIGANETLTQQLNKIGYDCVDVRIVVLSHLHQDHVGGLAELTGAEILVSERERAGLDRPFAATARGLLRDHLDLPGLRWVPVTPPLVDDPTIAPFTHAYDLFGDGTLVLVPTPGHTPGSLSLLLRQPGIAPMLFVGDLTYDVDLLDAGRVPGVGRRRGLRESSRAVNRLRAVYPDLVILPAHDPSAADRLRRAVAASTLA